VVFDQANSGVTIYGSSATDNIVGSGGNEFVMAGGTTVSITVNDGGTETVFLSGTASGTAVYSGTEIVSPGGTTISTTLDELGSEEDVYGTASDTTVDFSGLLNVSSGGMAIGTTVNAFLGEVVHASGTAVSTTVGSGGLAYVFSGGTAISTMVGISGKEDVSSDANDTTVDGGGSQFVAGSGTASFTTLSSGGYQIVSSGAATVGTTVGSGGVEGLSDGGTASSTTVDSGGFEVVSYGGTAISTMVNLGGAIDLAYLAYAPGGSASVNTSSLLTISIGGQIDTLQLSGDYAGEYFGLAPDNGSNSGTLATLSEAPCYRSGTHILTDHGEVAVEDLRVGDLVRTVLGETAAPIIWIGRRAVDCARHPRPRQVWPVRVAAGAFGPGRPHTELFLSPDHAVYVGEVLIPVKHLINRSTIVQVPAGRVAYYHIELSEHDVLLAEGLPAESFLDMKDGSNYARRAGPVRRYPDFSLRMWEAFGCARLVVTGPDLAAARALVAGFAMDQAAA
jgi:autotransporter passenger strand-loop-strand repeat protein